MAPADGSSAANTQPNWSDLWQRFKTALVVGPPILLALYVGHWPFAVVMIVGGGLIYREWDRMSRKTEGDPVLWIGIATVAIAGFLAASLALGYAFLSLLAGYAVMCLFRRDTHNRAWMGFGLLYAGLPVIGLIQLRTIPDVGFLAVGWTLTTVWATDIGAYAAGRAFGGPKLIPAISPKKTWAGFVGGIVGALIWSAGFRVVFGFSWELGFVLPAVLVALAGQAGDLFESWVKRHFGVKDTGTIFPGHGGFMDRADSVVMAAIVVSVLNAAGIAFIPLGAGAGP